MKIRKLQLKNIGVFDDETIEFQPCPVKDKAEIHIFTGQNGSGKSTILMALGGLFSLDPPERNQAGKLFGILSLNKSFEKRIRNDVEAQLDISLVESDHTRDYSYNISDNQPYDVRSLMQLTFHNIIDEKLMSYSQARVQKMQKHIFSFSLFAYSGYRRIKDEKINLFDEIEENPLNQALNFVKDENSTFTINQWLGRNLSKRALALEDKDKNAEQFTKNIQNLEKAITDIVGYEIRFKLKTDLSLVLVKENQEFDFDVLPDGLKSLISWIGDLLMRLDSLKWENDTPIFEREIILFLDEIEVHLHPAWQRKVLPVVQKLFKNSQIFVSTHSPFVVNSIDDAWVYKLKLENGKAKVANIERSEDARSYRYVLRNTFDIENEFGIEIEKRLKDFYKERDAILAGNGNSKKAKAELKKIAKELSKQSKELKTKIDFELFQLSEATGEDF